MRIRRWFGSCCVGMLLLVTGCSNDPGIEGDRGPCVLDRDCGLGQVCATDRCVAGCRDSRDCPADRAVCDPGAGPHGSCVQCRDQAQCGRSERCVAGECLASCDDSTDCASGVCDVATGVCVECRMKEHCALGQVCRAQRCEAGCEVDLDCPVATPACDPAAGAAGTCFVCTEDADCGGVRRCIDHTCQSALDMVEIPAGTFTMGSDTDADPRNPSHLVTLAAYAIDVHEVTNARYQPCVAAGACTRPTSTVEYNDPARANRPVVYVTHGQATAFCAWLGRRLPTEAEWERAARGTDGRTFPWGNQPATCALTNAAVAANQAQCVGTRRDVGSYPAGRSPVLADDLAGNVREWVSDWYAPYPPGPATDPRGPSTGSERIARGGSFVTPMLELTTYERPVRPPTMADEYIGFRCAYGSPATTLAADLPARDALPRP